MTNKTLPDGWQWKKLGEACELNPPKSEVRNLEDCLVSFVPMADLKEKQKFFESKQEKKLSEVYSGYTYFAENDVLLAKVTPCFENGKSGIARNLKNGKGFGSSEYYVLRGNEKILKEWIYYTIANKSFLNLGAENMSGAVGLKRVTKDFLYNYLIPLPPLEEQKRIVAKIDAAFEQLDEAISLQKNNILRTETLKKAILEEKYLEISTKNSYSKIKEIADSFNGYAFDSKAFNDLGIGNQVVRIGNVLDLNKNPVYINPNEKFRKWLLKESDIIMSLTGTREKKDYLFASIINKSNLYLNQRVACFRTKGNCFNKFLYYFFWTNLFRGKIFESETGAVNQGNMSLNDIINFEIPLPPIAEQEKIVAYLDKSFAEIDRMLEAQKIRLAHLEGMKKAILQEAFWGKL